MDNLSRDSCEALRLGMSYGKYKAMYPGTVYSREEKREIEPDNGIGICPECGIAFRKTRANHLCCCPACANRRRYRLRKQREEQKNAE